MKSIYKMPGVVRLLLSQAQVAFNDNAVKLTLISLAPLVLPEEQAAQVVSLVAALLVLPFVLFAPLVGWINDRFPKKHVVQASLIMQTLVMLILLVSLWFQSLFGVLCVFFLLGLQSCLMSPGKRGITGELVETRRVGEIMGILEMLVVGGVLMGSLAGGLLLEQVVNRNALPWQAAFYTIAIFLVGCLVAWWLFLPVPVKAAPAQEPFRWRIIFGHFQQLRDLWSRPVVFKAALGDSVFWFVGGVMVLILAQLGRELHPGSAKAGAMTAVMSATLGIGIIAGAVTAARICRDKIHTGLIPVGAIGMTLGLITLALLPKSSVAAYGALMGMGFAAGWFLVPLSGLLVARSPEAHRGELLAASSLLSSLTGVVAVGFQALLAQGFGMPIWGQLLVLAGVVMIAGIYLIQLLPDEMIRLFGMGVAALHYRVHPQGQDSFPAEGGVLLLSNHVSYVDALILSLACPRPVRFLSLDSLFNKPVTGWLLRVFGAIPISSRHAKDAIKKAVAKVKEGEVVCIFPEGQLTKNGSLMDVKSGFELIARQAQQKVVVVHMDGLWGSICSFERGKLFWKWPRKLRLYIDVRFGSAMAPEAATKECVIEFWNESACGGRDEAFLKTYATSYDS
jgi:acyl-[acyl-carrier-protein]-phospholipid O-acyltransferase/long-chain-fatty-acid--[acyl-carrier-protein] ligase